MNIFIREFIANRKSLIIWSISLVLFIIMGMQKYDALISTGSQAVIDMMNSLPQSIQAVFGLSKLDVTSMVGYYGILYLYLMLIVSIHAIGLGSNLIGKEEKEKTAEFLMVKPISRSKIVSYKMLLGIFNIIILNIVSFVSSLLITFSISKVLYFNDILLLHVGMFFTQLLFLIIGIGVASVLKTPKKNGLITMSILLFAFFMSMIIDIKESLNFLSFLTPFKYFDAKTMLPNGSISLIYLALVLFIIGIILIISYRNYKKRDLYL